MKGMTATQQKLQQERAERILQGALRQIEMAAMAGIDDSPFGTAAPQPTVMRFPDRFFEVHKDRFRQAAGRHTPGAVIAMICMENYDHFFGSDTSYLIHFKLVVTDRGTHIVPYGISDVATAAAWELRYKGIPDSEFIDK